MNRKLSRILGIAGAVLTLLPYLLFVGSCLYTLCLPDSEVHFESKGYASGFLVIFAIPTIAAVVGFVGSLFVGKRDKLSGVLMTISGALTFIIGMPMMINNIAVAPLGSWVNRIAPLILLAAGILVLVSNQRMSRNEKPLKDA